MADILATGQALISPLESLLRGFVTVLPSVLAAILILILGYFVSLVLGYVVKKILVKAGIDNWMQKAKLDDAIGHINVSSLAAIITKWYVFILFLIPAAEAVRTMQLGGLLADLAAWLPNLIVALIIIIFGLISSDYLYDKMMRAKMRGIGLASSIIKWVILIFIALIALKQIGVNVAIAENVILIIVAAVAIALALAIGISFGFGLKDEAKNIVKAVKKKV